MVRKAEVLTQPLVRLTMRNEIGGRHWENRCETKRRKRYEMGPCVSDRCDDCSGSQYVEWMSLVATPCAARTATTASDSCTRLI